MLGIGKEMHYKSLWSTDGVLDPPWIQSAAMEAKYTRGTKAYPWDQSIPVGR